MKRLIAARCSVGLVAVFTTLPVAAADRVFEDRVFVAEEWSFEVFTGGFGGTGAVFRDLEPGGLPSPYRIVRITVNYPSATVGSVVHTFHGKLDARHNPSVDGEIFAVNYSDYSRHLSPPLLGRNGMRVALALKQGTNYFSAPNPVLYAGSEDWTSREQQNLTATDFAPMAGSLQSAKPDFSTNGTEILFGFARALSTPAGSYPGQTPGNPGFSYDSALDNWRVELLLSDPGTTNKLPRAGRRLETYALREDHPTWPEPVLEAFDTRVEPSPLPNLSNELTATAIVTGVGGASGFGVASAQARTMVFSGVRSRAQGGVMIDPMQPRERRAEATARDIRHFVAQAPSGTSEAEIDLWMVADGFFDFLGELNNPWEPYGNQLTAWAEQSVILHRVSQTRSIMRGAARVFRVVGNPSIRITAEDSWQGAVSFQPYGNGAIRRPTIHYSEILGNVATVPVGEPFALEFRLRATARAGDEAAGWEVVADLYNTAGYTVQTSTPGVQILEITPTATPPLRLGIRQLPAGIQLYTTQDPGPAQLVIEFSTGLAHWDDLGPLTPVANEWRIDVPLTSPSGSHFYRAVRR